jgi:hypothetical protein
MEHVTMKYRTFMAAAVLWIGLSSSIPAAASTPEDAFWSDDFAAPNFDWRINALASYGTDLIAGGFFHQTPGGLANGIARWTGTAWQPMGVGLGQVQAFAMFRGNPIAAGYFLPADNYRWVARWNGDAWLPLDAPGYVGGFTLLGNDLIACGSFTWGDSSTIAARWDGSRWHPFGSGIPDASISAHACIIYDSLLYVAGNFRGRSENQGSLVMRWTGDRWDTLATGSFKSAANAFAIHHGTLFVGGEFTSFGVSRSPLMALRDGQLVSAGPYTDGSVNALLDTPAGLVLGGAFGATSSISVAIFDSTETRVVPGITGSVTALQKFGSRIVAAGLISVGAPAAFGCGAWDGSHWELLTGDLPSGHGLYGTNQAVVMCLFPDADTLFAAGRFEMARNGRAWIPLNNVARWNGHEWSAVGFDHLDGWVWALTRYHGDLIAAGDFEAPPDSTGPVRNIARWDGSRWRNLGPGIDGQVRTLAVFQDALVAGGAFVRAGNVQSAGIARWNGTDWDAMGTVELYEGSIGVENLLVHGDRLFVCGEFGQIGDIVAHSVASWDGAYWLALGNSANGFVSRLAFYGDSLIASGLLHGVDTSSPGLLSWDGSTWLPFPRAMSPGTSLQTLALFPDGKDLYVGGWFDTYGETPAHNIVRWNGVDWRPLGSGIGAEDIAFGTYIGAIGWARQELFGGISDRIQAGPSEPIRRECLDDTLDARVGSGAGRRDRHHGQESRHPVAWRFECRRSCGGVEWSEFHRPSCGSGSLRSDVPSAGQTDPIEKGRPATLITRDR